MFVPRTATTHKQNSPFAVPPPLIGFPRATTGSMIGTTRLARVVLMVRGQQGVASAVVRADSFVPDAWVCSLA
jgi:hypothetical protein